MKRKKVNSMFSRRDGNTLRETCNRSLCRGIACGVRARLISRRAGDVDDSTPVACDHAWQHRMHKEERAEEIDLHVLPPLIRINHPERTKRYMAPCIVDQNIYSTKLLFNIFHALRDS